MWCCSITLQEKGGCFFRSMGEIGESRLYVNQSTLEEDISLEGKKMFVDQTPNVDW